MGLCWCQKSKAVNHFGGSQTWNLQEQNNQKQMMSQASQNFPQQGKTIKTNKKFGHKRKPKDPPKHYTPLELSLNRRWHYWIPKGIKSNGVNNLTSFQDSKVFDVIVSNLHDVWFRPEDAVLMVIFSWIKPEIVSLFSSQMSAPISVNVCLNPPFFSSNITKKLKIDLIMVLLIHVSIWHLKNSKSQK